jgi:transposase
MYYVKRSRRTLSDSFKSKMVLETLKEQSTLQELSSKYKIHAQQITTWKSEFFESKSWENEYNRKKIKSCKVSPKA